MGDKIAHSVSDFFNDQKVFHILKTLKSLGLKLTNPDFEGEEKQIKPLDSLSFVITGTLPKPRNEVEDLIENLGGHATSSVSKNTGYLVAGTDPDQSSGRQSLLG